MSEGTRTPDTQDHNGVLELQPFLGVDEVFLPGVLAGLRLQGCHDPADSTAKLITKPGRIVSPRP